MSHYILSLLLIFLPACMKQEAGMKSNHKAAFDSMLLLEHMENQNSSEWITPHPCDTSGELWFKMITAQQMLKHLAFMRHVLEKQLQELQDEYAYQWHPDNSYLQYYAARYASLEIPKDKLPESE